MPAPDRDLLLKLDAKMDRFDQHLAEVKSDLREHMRRTAAAEEGLELLRSEVEPLKTHVVMWAGASKALTLVLGIGGLVFAALKVFL